MAGAVAPSKKKKRRSKAKAKLRPSGYKPVVILHWRNPLNSNETACRKAPIHGLEFAEVPELMTCKLCQSRFVVHKMWLRSN